MRTKPWMLALLILASVTTTACTGRKGTPVRAGDHSTYQHHYHDKNGVPHPKPGGLLPPPHNHQHGQTWK